MFANFASSTPDLPAPVRILGLAGILPQFACIGLALAGYGDFATQAGLAYAAVILSFLGGMWWMLALLAGSRAVAVYIVAVFPSLIGWGAMLLPAGGLVVVSLCLLASPLVDGRLARLAALPDGWIRLRWQMATGLGLSTMTLAVLAA